MANWPSGCQRESQQHLAVVDVIALRSRHVFVVRTRLVKWHFCVACIYFQGR